MLRGRCDEDLADTGSYDVTSDVCGVHYEQAVEACGIKDDTGAPWRRAMARSSPTKCGAALRLEAGRKSEGSIEPGYLAPHAFGLDGYHPNGSSATLS